MDLGVSEQGVFDEDIPPSYVPPMIFFRFIGGYKHIFWLYVFISFNQQLNSWGFGFLHVDRVYPEVMVHLWGK